MAYLRAFGKTCRIGSRLSVGEYAFSILVDKLHRVFNCDNVFMLRLVYLIEHRCQRG